MATKDATVTLDTNVNTQFTTDNEGNRRLVVTKKYDVVKDGNVELDDQGKELHYSQTVTRGQIVASDAGDAGDTFTDTEITFGDLGVNTYNQIQYADKEKKAALLESVANAKNEGELAVAMQAITDSYNSTTDNIGQKGYEEAQRVAAAKKQSFLTGAEDEVQAGNATNVNGNAYDVRDASSKGDGRTADVVDGNSDLDVESGSIRDDNASGSTRLGNGGTLEEGTGEGLGNGTGTGAGYGNGNGNGVDNGEGTGAAGGYNSDGSPIGTAAVPDTNNTQEKDAIASYLSTVAGDVPINHIFHNDFYRNEPIAKWSFSIDFVPAVNLLNTNIDLYEYGRTLTKAVIATRVPERSVKSTVSHYKGMTIELPARAKTAGMLTMTFAENNAFHISSILNDLYQYARSDTYFESIDSELAEMKHKDDEELQQQIQFLRSYRRALPTGGHLYNILIKMYRMKDAKALDDVDSLEYPTFVYFFKGCDLKGVKPVEFDYDNDKPIDVSCEWIYQFFEELTFDEYLQRYGSAANDVSTEETNEQMEKDFESFKDDAPNAQEGMDNLMNDFKKTSYWEALNKYGTASEPTGNLSPASMTQEGAKDFRESYKPVSVPQNTYSQASYGRRR